MWRKTILSVLIGAFLLVLLVGVGLWGTTARVQSDALPVLAPIEVTPGLIIEGQVSLREEGGPGVAGVVIYRRYATYPGTVVATTRPDGSYQTEFSYISGEETVHLWAILTPYAMQPQMYDWRHYYGYREVTRNFVATAPYSRYVPLLWRRSAGVGPQVDGQ
jgi:hypothetical protein